MVSVTEAQERGEQRRHSPRHSDSASRLLAKAPVQQEWEKKKLGGLLGGSEDLDVVNSRRDRRE